MIYASESLSTYLAWISTDQSSPNAALAQDGYGTAESGSERYLKLVFYSLKN